MLLITHLCSESRVLCRAWCLEDMSVLPVARFPIDGSKYRAKNSTASLSFSISSCAYCEFVSRCNQNSEITICNLNRRQKTDKIDRPTSILCITVSRSSCCRWTIESGLREHHDAWPLLPCRSPSRLLAPKNLLRCK